MGAGGSHVEFPDDVRDIEGQITWGLDQIKENGKDMLAEAFVAAWLSRGKAWLLKPVRGVVPPPPLHNPNPKSRASPACLPPISASSLAP